VPIIILIIVLAAAWALLVMPRRRQQRAHTAMQDSLGLGDEIITAGGLHGHVRELADDVLQIEIAPGTLVRLDRRAVAAVAREVEVEVAREAEPEPAPEPDPAAEVETEPR
jgi:preprotein translocase subunit YajC